MKPGDAVRFEKGTEPFLVTEELNAGWLAIIPRDEPSSPARQVRKTKMQYWTSMDEEQLPRLRKLKVLTKLSCELEARTGKAQLRLGWHQLTEEEMLKIGEIVLQAEARLKKQLQR